MGVLRSVASKMAWVGRTASMVFGLALVMALVLGVATTAMGANGQSFILGKLDNAATRVTGLVGNADGAAALRVTNPSTGTNDTALDLRVQAGEAPMKVNSSTRVANLNADMLDGQEPNQLASILRAQQDTDVAGSVVSDTTQVNSVSIDAPVSGVLVISGTAFVNNDISAPTQYSLNPKVDGTSATPTNRAATFVAAANSGGGGQAAEFFTLSYTVSEPVGAGSHTVTQELGRAGGGAADFFYNNNELSVQFVPGTGASVSDTASAVARAAQGVNSPTGE